MSETPLNITRFNLLTGHLFNEMYQKFPMQLEVNCSALQREVFKELLSEDSTTEFEEAFEDEATMGEFAEATISWLTQNGFIHREKPEYYGSGFDHRITLSEKGLAVLKLTPKTLDGSVPKSFADDLRASIKKGALDRVGKTTGEILNQGVGLIHRMASGEIPVA